MREFEFCLLGPLTVRRGGAPVTVPRGAQRAILAMLLLNADRVVRQDELAETLWAAGPPPSGPVAVQNYVMRLRKTLGKAGRDRIITQPPGYLIHVLDGELDTIRFEALLDAARTAARTGSWDQAVTRAREALRLWRGEPLADVYSDVLTARNAIRLAEMRLQALEIRIDADQHLGRHAEVIAELRQLASEHPLRERLHGGLMLSLYRDGRQAEALAAYADARRILVSELGTEPGARLRELHQQILTADPALGIPPGSTPVAIAGPATTPTAPTVPRELPTSVRNFTGRSDELQSLTKLLDLGENVPGTVVISAIGGTAGVGKTALAVHWAHQVADRFPDGQLYVNLRGYDPEKPMLATDALAGFLRALGAGGQEIPGDAAERAARYRSLLAARRMLVVLDNASDVEQIRPLLPASPGCMVLVTSRDSLAGLVARDGAVRLELDLLPPADAVGLLRELIGSRVDTEPSAAAALAAQCGRLPLALRVAAEIAIARPTARLAELAAELADQRPGLQLLEAGGDPRTAVRAVFSWSYRYLKPDAARAFRLFGLHPGPDLDLYAAAALTDTSLPKARSLLDQLARAQLIHLTGPGRYGMRDLLSAYARQLTAEHDSAADRRAGLTRLFNYYASTAATAMGTMYPQTYGRKSGIKRPTTPTPAVADRATAGEWLKAEQASLVAIARYTAENGWPRHATQLSAILIHHYTGNTNPEASIIGEPGHRAALAMGDRVAEAVALYALGQVAWSQVRYRSADAGFRDALAQYRAITDPDGKARALHGLGLIALQEGRYETASDCFRQAVALCRQPGDLAAGRRP
ncbi:MAG TPA: BTAD domain-containing putative transcriptional regulator [Streptosporangiaceae bacterium]|nr:BTAD domain-containing putative transcriptional regulator [Streptosporangiaceae bacterium]